IAAPVPAPTMAPIAAPRPPPIAPPTMAPAAPPNSAPPSVLSCAAASCSGAQTASATSIESANFGIMSVLRPFGRFAGYFAASFDIGRPSKATQKQEQFAVQPVVGPEEITGRAMSDTYIIEVASQPAGIIV